MKIECEKCNGNGYLFIDKPGHKCPECDTKGYKEVFERDGIIFDQNMKPLKITILKQKEQK